jgi:PAS domain S-box-containing protein
VVKRPGVTAFLDAFSDTNLQLCDMETDLLIVLDGQGQITRTYPGFTKALGYTEADVLGMNIMRLIESDDVMTFVKAATGFPYPRPFRMTHKGGGVVKVKLEAAQFNDQQCGYLIMRRV